jgi:hypothetical protein
MEIKNKKSLILNRWYLSILSLDIWLSPGVWAA